MDASRETQIRDYPFSVTRSEDTGDGLTLEGYAVVFDQPTRIESNRGPFIETMKRGAFTKTLSERTPVLMFNHGQHPLIQEMPIGKIEEAREDAHGLFIRARLADNYMTVPVRDAIRMGAITGMSFRMSNIKEVIRSGKTPGALQERDVTEVRCPELGPVVFPAYDSTSVAVRSMAAALQNDEARSDVVRALWMATEERQNPIDDAYADPGFRADGMRRYPINTGTHVETAWAFINIERNQAGYTAQQIASIKQRIQAAAETFNVNLDELKSPEEDGEIRIDVRAALEAAIALHEGVEAFVADCTDRTAFYSVIEDGELSLREIEYTIDDEGAVAFPATSDEAAEGTSDEAGRTTTEPDDSTPGRITPDPLEQRLVRQLRLQKIGIKP